jgi:hypothetical protein
LPTTSSFDIALDAGSSGISLGIDSLLRKPEKAFGSFS